VPACEVRQPPSPGTTLPPTTGSVAGPSGSAAPSGETVSPDGSAAVISPAESPCGAVAVTRSSGASSVHVVPSLLTVVSSPWLTGRCARTSCRAWSLSRCEVCGLVCAREWPTSATDTSTGQRASRRLR
jgi:hypothetical protein